MFSSLWPIVISLISTAISMVVVMYASNLKGKTDAQIAATEKRAADAEALAVNSIKQTKAETENVVAAVSIANESSNDVMAMSDAAVRNELRKYAEDGNGAGTSNR